MGDYTVQGASATLPSFNPSGAGDGPVAITKRGELVTIPWYQEWIDKERGYMVSNAAKQTALATGGLSYSDTAPAFILDVAAGTTMVPMSIRLRQGGVAGGGVITVLITADVIARYSSGGTAVTVRNMKMGPSAPTRRASGVTVYSTSPTAAAVNTHITLFGAILIADVATSPHIAGAEVTWPELNEPVPNLVGPASLVIYSFAGTTQPSWFFQIQWIEVDS